MRKLAEHSTQKRRPKGRRFRHICVALSPGIEDFFLSPAPI
jgi:hypothetical protein